MIASNGDVAKLSPITGRSSPGTAPRSGNDGERGLGAVRLALLEVALGLCHRVRDVSEADDRVAARCAECVGGRSLHLHGERPQIARSRDRRFGLSIGSIRRPGRAAMQFLRQRSARPLKNLASPHDCNHVLLDAANLMVGVSRH